MNKGRKPDPDQLILQFNGPPDETAWRQKLIRRIDHRRTGLSRRVWKGCEDMLCFMARCDKGLGIFPFVASIANAIGCSETTVKRYIRNCVSLGILRSVRHGSTSNHYFIENRKLFELSRDDDEVAVETPAVATDQIGPSDSPNWPNRSAKLVPQIDQIGPAQLIERTDCVNQSTATDAAAWTEAEVAVDLCGVNQFKTAVGLVRDRGGLSTDVLEIVAWWQEHRGGWDEQHASRHLYQRLRRWAVGQAVEDHWEPFMPEYKRRLASKKHEDKLAREAAQRRAEAASRSEVKDEPIDMAAELEAAGDHVGANRIRAKREPKAAAEAKDK